MGTETKIEWCDPIIITGCPRSGTSHAAAALEACGVHAGECPGNTWRTTAPHHEHPAVVAAVRLALEREGIDYLRSIEETASTAAAPEIRRRIVARVSPQPGDFPWLIKSPGILRCWRAFDAAFPAARWIVTTRPHAEQVDALRRAHPRVIGQAYDWDRFAAAHEMLGKELAIFVDVAYLPAFDVDALLAWADACPGLWGASRERIAAVTCRPPAAGKTQVLS